MDNSNKITVGVGIDSKEAERKLSELEKKIKSMREFGPSGNLAQLSQNYRSSGQEERAKRIEDFRKRQDINYRKEVIQNIEKQEKKLDELLKKEETVNKLLENRKKTGLKNLEIQDKYKQKLEDIGKAAKTTADNIKKAEESLAKNTRGLGDIIGGGIGPLSGYQTARIRAGFRGGIGRGMGEVGKAFGFKSPLSFASGILGAVGTALPVISNAYGYLNRYDERLAGKEVGIKRAETEDLRMASEGKLYEKALYNQAYKTAEERAIKAGKTRRLQDKMEIGGSALAMTGGIVAGPAAPLVIGAGALALGGQAIFNDRKRAMITGNKENYKKEMEAYMLKVREEQLQIEKEKMQELKIGAATFSKNKGRFLKTQRALGLSDEDLWKGEGSTLVQGMLQGGYGREEIQSAMMGISGAGGTTMAAKSGGIISAKMQRNLDLTNAPQLMGLISGAKGLGAGESKDQIIRMFAEATRIGLDTSETREYIQTVADISYQTTGDTGVISGLISAGTKGSGLNSKRGIQASVTAFEKLRQETSESGGLTGQYKMASFFDKGLNIYDTNYLSNIPIEQITEENPFVKRILERNKGKINVEDIRKIVLESTTRNTETSEMLKNLGLKNKKLRKMEQTKGVSVADIKKMDELRSQIKNARSDIGVRLEAERGLKLDQRALGAYVDQSAATMVGDTEGAKLSKERYEKIQKEMDKEDPERLGDKAYKNIAKQQLSEFANLNNVAGKLAKAFDMSNGLGYNVKAVNDQLIKMKETLEEITKKPELSSASLKLGAVGFVE